jgi:MFS family permease
MKAASSRRSEAFRFIVALGLVSLFADMVYEGARSILGPFLVTLGASAAAIGLISGVGEFVGYALRVVAGYAADRSHRYWALTIAGYLLTLVAVPLLGLVGRIDLAFALVIAERLGKAIRTPARDALLSHASYEMGRGAGFGLHEALDQIGAVVSPLVLGLVLALREGDYRLAFGVLAVPGLMAVAALIWARLRVPDPATFEPPAEHRPEDAGSSSGIPAAMRRYLTFVFVATLGFAPFPLVAFHLTTHRVVSETQIPILFALAMAIDAAVALGAGRLYDRRGLAVLMSVPVITAASLVVFSESPALAWIGAALWGAVLGMQESTLRAAVGDLVETRRATAYGVFNAAYGLALLGGGSFLGLIYERSVPVLVAYVVAAQLLALLIFAPLRAPKAQAHS